jgi:exosortase
VFPIAFLVFMIPLPAIVMNAIAFPLQQFAAQSATFCMEVAGIPVLREGNTIVLSNTTLEVVEACSGIRSLQALLALGAVYGSFTQKAAWKRWALLLLSIPIAIAANAFRVAGTGFLAHFIGPAAAQGFYHSFAGWIVFAVAFVLLLGAGTLLGRLPDGGRAQAEPQS